MVFLNPWGPNIMVWTLQCLGKDFLFKSILAGCDTYLNANMKHTKFASLIDPENSKIMFTLIQLILGYFWCKNPYPTTDQTNLSVSVTCIYRRKNSSKIFATKLKL